MSEMFGFDAFSPKQIARRVSDVGVEKEQLPFQARLLLAVLAGAFIGLGALYSMVVRADPELGFAAKQVLSGVAFSLGLVLVVVAGAELFTGNNLLAMAWAGRRISTAALLRNWGTVLVGNAIGALGLAGLVLLSGHLTQNDGALAAEYVRVAQAKGALEPMAAFARAVLCNALVCMAVWMATAGRSVGDKVVAIVFPVSAFVAAGFEHSVANFYLFPVAMAAQIQYGIAGPGVSLAAVFHNLLPVLAGNIVGGSVLVALIYFLIYERGRVAGEGDGGEGEKRG